MWISAQTPFFKKHPLGESYRNAKIEVIFEAQNSLLWFGTSEGLVAYDGLEFLPYLKKDTTSEHVRAIYQDTEGILWVGYQDGSIYQLHKHQLIQWMPEEGTPAKAITGFAEDNNGHLWIATYGEGVYFHNGRHLYNVNIEDGLLGDDIYVMKPDEKGHMWLGTDGGISICSFIDGKKTINNIKREDGLPDEIVREILRDEKGNFWIGTYDKGVCYFDVKKQQFEYPIENWNHGIVSNLELYEGRELWIGTEGNGVWLLSLVDGSLRRLLMKEDIANDKIYDLHKDIEGNIWIVSNTHGICQANRQFEFIKTDFGSIQAISTNSDNQTWIGTQDGLYTHHVDSLGNSYFQQHLKDLQLNVLSLYEDKFQNLWIGTFGDWVYVFNKKSGQTHQLTQRDGLTNGSILSIAGTEDYVWIATLGGVTEIQLEGNPMNASHLNSRNFNQENGLGTNFIYKVFIDSRGRTWFATDGKGISVLENGQIKNYQIAYAQQVDGKVKNTELKSVYAITEDHQGHIWLSTAQSEIFEYNDVEFKQLTVKEGIRDLEITNLITDANGNILIVHPTGIDILEPESHHLIYYNDEVGIQNIDPSLNASCADNYNNIWIGCKNEIIKFSALNEELEIHPRTRLNNVSVFLEPIDFQEKNTFSHGQNNFMFDYFGLWYTDPSTVRYRYQLEGYDHDWINTKDRQVTFSNLPFGNYKFKVTSTENDAWLDEPIISYEFEILSPLWLRWWFISLCALAVGGGFYWYQKVRDQRLQKVNLLQKERIISQFEALKSQINPHFLFNSFNTLVIIIEESPSVAVEYVERLSDFYRSIMQYRETEVISLQEEIELVKNYSFLLEKRFGDNFKLDIQTNGQSAFVVPLTLQILVENAIKHNIVSKSKPLQVTIRYDKETDFIVVTNNLQRKINPENSTRFGLQSLEKRYALLSGKKVKVEVNSDFFQVCIPVIK